MTYADQRKASDPILPFNILVKQSDREVIYAAISGAKNLLGTDDGTEALVYICAQFVNSLSDSESEE
jgi:hypothetical protein